MAECVLPKVYLVGCSIIDECGMMEYLKDSGQEEFLKTINEAWYQDRLSDGEVLTSFYAKLCYASLVEDSRNKNISKVRGIKANLLATMEQAHGSVFEHVQLNFVVRNCSRVFTHEQVRHRVGTAYSQTSGRYVRGETIDFVMDPILEPVRDEIRKTLEDIEDRYNRMVSNLDLDWMKDFTLKKKLTSALRRILPNGQSNEMGMSLNLRTLRHIIQLRTSRHAEWEIRYIYAQIYSLVKEKYPLLFYDAKEEMIDNIMEVSGMKLQPYERKLSDYSSEELEQELAKREEK